MKKEYYLVGVCIQCGEEVWSNHLVDIPGLCLHRKCLDNYNKQKLYS